MTNEGVNLLCDYAQTMEQNRFADRIQVSFPLCYVSDLQWTPCFPLYLSFFCWCLFVNISLYLPIIVVLDTKPNRWLFFFWITVDQNHCSTLVFFEPHLLDVFFHLVSCAPISSCWLLFQSCRHHRLVPPGQLLKHQWKHHQGLDSFSI